MDGSSCEFESLVGKKLEGNDKRKLFVTIFPANILIEGIVRFLRVDSNGLGLLRLVEKVILGKETAGEGQFDSQGFDADNA